MAFNASGTESLYRGDQAARDRADEGLSRALDAKGKNKRKW